MTTRRRATAAVAGVVLMASGCVLAPRGADAERQRLARAGEAYEQEIGKRELPEIGERPDWPDVLRRAFLANGELEAAYHAWAMAVRRINQEGTWPTQPVEVGFDYMFSGERMKTFDRMTFSVGLMGATALPNKTYAAAEVAWRDAQAAGERFRAAKFDLQMRVLQAWAEYALQAERVRIQEQNLSLLRLVSETAAGRVRVGASQQEQLRADVAYRSAANELATARSELARQRATLNALLRREADAPLEPPATLPAPRPLTGDDEAIIAAGVRNNAALAELGYDRAAREAAIRRARLEYWPEINPMAAFTGSVTQSLGAAITLPTQFPRLRAMVAEARDDLRRVEAMAAQAKADRAAGFVAALLAIRDAERRRDVFEQDVIPLAERAVDLARQSYANGSVEYLDLIDAQRTLLDTRLMGAEARTMRERMLAELEALAGMDVEVLSTPATTTRPADDRTTRDASES